jgi:hypothetical protein
MFFHIFNIVIESKEIRVEEDEQGDGCESPQARNGWGHSQRVAYSHLGNNIPHCPPRPAQRRAAAVLPEGAGEWGKEKKGWRKVISRKF